MIVTMKIFRLFVTYIFSFGLVLGYDDLCWSDNGVNDSTEVNNKCFQLFSIQISWRESQDFCSSLMFDGSLAEPKTQKERNVTVTLAQMSTSTAVWLGANDMVTEGSFYWVNSQLNLLSQDQWWYFGQPDNQTSDDDCVGISTDNGKIYDLRCSDRLFPLCQYAKMKDPPTDPCYPLKTGVYANGKCLQLLNLNRSWIEAQTFCSALHPRANLYEIMSEADRDEMISLVLNSSITSFWIGGQDRNKNQQFTWATNPDIPILLNQWSKLEPHNWPPGEDCVAIYKDNTFNDVQCDSPAYFLCQISLLYPGQTCSFVGSSLVVTVNTKCFIFMTSEMKTFMNANQTCVDAGSMLAEPVTAEERQAITSSPFFNTKYLLIGATDSNFEGEFVWIHNQSVLRLNWWVYGQPDNVQGDEFCVAFDSGTGQLLDSSCSVQLPFLCQIEVPNPCDTILPGAVYSDGHCFKHYNQTLSWSQAQAFCLNKNSHLAEPNTKIIERALNVFLKSWKFVWLGGQDIYTNRTFQWSLSETTVSTQHLSTTNNSSQNYLVWHKTSDGIFYEDRNDTEQYSFVCQTAAIQPNSQKYVAVVPRMTEGSHIVYLQVTTGYVSAIIYLQIKKVYDVTVQETTVVPLTYNKKAINLDINGALIISDMYTFTRYVQVQSNQPVTVVLYIKNNLNSQISSTLLLPDSVYNRSPMATSYILQSAFSDKDNSITVLSKSNALTNVTFMYNSGTKLDHSRSTFSIGNVQISTFFSSSLNLPSLNDALSLSVRSNLDGSYIFGNQPFATFIQTKVTTNVTSDYTMDTIIPVDYLGSEYVVFSTNIGFGALTIKIVAAFDWTNVTIYYTNAINSTILKAVGDIYEKRGASTIYYIVGNASFYAYRIDAQGNSACVTSLVPTTSWQYQYDLYISSALSSYSVSVFFVVPSEYKNSLECNNKPLAAIMLVPSPQGLGTLYAIVKFTSNKDVDKHFHFQITDRVKPFGAYVYGSNANSLFCHPLGFSHPVEQPSPKFDHQNFLDQLMLETTVQPQVSCSEETTPAYLTDSTPYGTVVSSNNTVSSTEDTTVLHATNEMKISDSLISENTAWQTIEISTSENTNTSVPGTSNSFVTDPIYHTTMETTNNTTETSYTSITSYHPLDFSSTTLKTYANIDITDLIIQAKNTSAYRRSLISVPDPRLSSKMIGGFGIIIMTLVFTSISFTDFISLLRVIYKLFCKKQ